MKEKRMGKWKGRLRIADGKLGELIGRLTGNRAIQLQGRSQQAQGQLEELGAKANEQAEEAAQRLKKP